jgi:hypothetical protein
MRTRKMRIITRGVSLLLTTALLLTSGASALAATPAELDTAIKDTASYIYNTVKKPQVGSVGGEWAVLGLARSGYAVPDQYYQDYYATVEKYVRDCQGVLHDKKYTEYDRVTVALSSIGRDPRSVAGYNLLTPLGDFDKTIWQGINGPVWALITLDSGGYPMPQNPAAAKQATRDMYVDEILKRQLPDGGFSLFGGTAAATAGDQTSDPDITGMALQALAKYQDREDVKKVTAEALACMSQKQDAKGGFASWGTANSESVVQIIVALTELGLPLDDPRFVKNGNTLLDNLLTFREPGKGFLHTADGSGVNQMASEQALYGLVAAQRALQSKNSLYRMGDAIKIADAVAEGTKTGGSPQPGETTQAGQGLPGKHADVKARPVVNQGKTFSDISTHQNRAAIEAMAARGIINGKTDTLFDPDGAITRAEFAAIVVRALGLPEQDASVFGDITAGSWYAGYVGAAYNYGIVKGKSASAFDPAGTITREEAATMVARAAKLCGMDTGVDAGAVRDVLAQFGDYVTASEWAQASLAFCYSTDILSQQDLDIRPQVPIKRAEIAEMLYRLLGAAELI